MQIKDFLKWFKLKTRLHSIEHKAPFVNEGDIWWASVGENIGSEINGKSQLFSRPVVIFKKLSHGFYLVIPTSTKVKTGTWYVPFSHKRKKMNTCLQQIRTIDYRRLSSKLGELDDEDMRKIKSGFQKLYL